MGQTGVPPAEVLVVGIWINHNDLTSQRHWNDGEGKGKCPNISLFQVGDWSGFIQIRDSWLVVSVANQAWEHRSSDKSKPTILSAPRFLKENGSKRSPQKNMFFFFRSHPNMFSLASFSQRDGVDSPFFMVSAELPSHEVRTISSVLPGA